MKTIIKATPSTLPYLREEMDIYFLNQWKENNGAISIEFDETNHRQLDFTLTALKTIDFILGKLGRSLAFVNGPAVLTGMLLEMEKDFEDDFGDDIEIVDEEELEERYY